MSERNRDIPDPQNQTPNVNKNPRLEIPGKGVPSRNLELSNEARMANPAGGDEQDPNKIRAERELRMQEMFGVRGVSGKMGVILNDARSLKNIEGITSAEDLKSLGIDTRGMGNLDEEQLNLVKEKMLNERRAEISESYVGMAHIFITEVNEINKFLEDLKNPYPYDSRWTIQMAKDALEMINAAIHERKGMNKEARTILKMVKKDCLWLMAAARHMEAMGPSYETYFDGEMEISQLRSNRSEILAGDHRKYFSEDLKGLKFSDEESLIIKNLFAQLPEEVKQFEGGVERPLREEAVEIQDRAGEWLLKVAAAHQKNLEFNFEIGPDGIPVDPEMGEHYALIDQVTFRFLSQVLNVGSAPGKRYTEDGVETPDGNLIYINNKGEKMVVARKMLNFFAMDQSDEKAVLYTKGVLHELVKNVNLPNVLKRIADSPSETWEELIKEEATKIISGAKMRVENADALDEFGAYDRLIDMTVQSITNLEEGTFAAGDMGWGWQYRKINLYNEDGTQSDEGKKLMEQYRWVFRVLDPEYLKSERKLDENGKNQLFRSKFEKLIQGTENGDQKNAYVVARKSDLGSIYDNHDLTTVYYGPKHIIDYDALADDRGTIYYATIGWYREIWDHMPPYWRPELRVFAKDDPVLLANFGVDAEGQVHVEKGLQVLEGTDLRKEYGSDHDGRKPRIFDGIDKRAAGFINDTVWGLVTWVLEEPGVKNSPNICLPIFMPTYVPEMNYWRTTSVMIPSAKIDGKAMLDGKEVKFGKESIWHQRLKGGKFSQFDWDNMPRYRFNYHRVTLDQLERSYGPVVTPYVYNRSTADQYEEFYDNPQGMGMAHKRGGKRERLGWRMDPRGNGVFRATVLPQNVAFTAAKESGLYSIDGKNAIVIQNQVDEKRRKWASPWIGTFLDMPGVILGIKKYGETCMAAFDLTYAQLERVAKSARKQTIGNSGQVDNSTQEILKKLQTPRNISGSVSTSNPNQPPQPTPSRPTPKLPAPVDFPGAEEDYDPNQVIEGEVTEL